MPANRILGILWCLIFTLTSLPTHVMAISSVSVNSDVSGNNEVSVNGDLPSAKDVVSIEVHKISPNSQKKLYKYDYIIVGNGTAGAVLARKLSDNKKNRVLVIEAGPNLSDDPVVLEPFSSSIANDLAYNPKYNFILSQYVAGSVFGPAVLTGTGRMWGGSSANNDQQIIRGTPTLWNSWAALTGNPRWLYNNVLPTMKAVETYTPNGTSPNLVQRGRNGPIFVTQSPPINSDPFAIAMSTATGTPFIPDYNDPSFGNVGISALQSSITPPPDSIRSFASNGYLPESVVTPEGKGVDRRLKIVSNSTVSRVLFNGKVAIGVEFIRSGKKPEKVRRAYANKKIILCAGALHTPGILQRSGIGDADLLDSLGIPVLVDNPNVGSNLSFQCSTVAVLAGPVTPPEDTIEDGFIDGAPYFPADGTRRIQINALTLPSENVELIGILLEPKSKGSINIVNKDPLAIPLLELSLFSDSEGSPAQFGSDAYTLVSFLKIAQAIAAAAGDTVIQPTPAQYASDEDLLQYIVNNPRILNSWTGSTKMSTSDIDGVVDSNLNVFGVTNLMIADLGVAPAQPDGENPCFPDYVIANEAAQIILSLPHQHRKLHRHHHRHHRHHSHR